MKSLHQAYVSLGANLDHPLASVQNALNRLATLTQTRLIAASSLYRTAPVGLSNQPDFINAVAWLETSFEPQELLCNLLALETEFGRVRKEKNGPRTLDLDLLLFDELVLKTEGLTLPHPRLHLRAFVLIPLAELAPNLIIPGRGTLSSCLAFVADQNVVRLS